MLKGSILDFPKCFISSSVEEVPLCRKNCSPGEKYGEDILTAEGIATYRISITFLRKHGPLETSMPGSPSSALRLTNGLIQLLTQTTSTHGSPNQS